MPPWMQTIVGTAIFLGLFAIIAWSVRWRRRRGMADGPLMLRGPDGRVVTVAPEPSLSPEARAAVERTVRPAKDLQRERLVAVHDASGVLGYPAWLVSFSGWEHPCSSYLVLEYDTTCPHAFTAIVSWMFKPGRRFRRARFLDGRVRGQWFQWDGWARDWPDTRPEVATGVGTLMRELAGSIRTKRDGIEYAPGSLTIAFAAGAEFKDADLADAVATFIEASERLWLPDASASDDPTLNGRVSS